MSKIGLGVPVKSRLPLKAWAVAAVVTLFSLASSAMHRQLVPSYSIYAALIADTPGKS